MNAFLEDNIIMHSGRRRRHRLKSLICPRLHPIKNDLSVETTFFQTRGLLRGAQPICDVILGRIADNSLQF